MKFSEYITDFLLIVWDLQGLKLTKKIEVQRPNEQDLYQYKDHQMDIVNYAPEHVLNTPGALQR